MAKQKKAAKLSPSSSVKTKSSIVTCPSVSSNIFSALDRIMSGKSWPRSESAEKINEEIRNQCEFIAHVLGRYLNHLWKLDPEGAHEVRQYIVRVMRVRTGGKP